MTLNSEDEDMAATNEMSLRDAVVVITGASSGIGAATAKALAADGATVVLAARRAERLLEHAETIEEKFDVETLVVPTDVTDDDAVTNLIESTVDEFGRIDATICNAGIGIDSPVESMETDTYRKMMDVNVDGMFFTARESIPYLRETEGHLVFVSSFAGKYPRPFNPVYAATKWWTEGFARSLEGSIGADGVAVTTVNPSAVRTEFGGNDDQSQKERFDPGEVIEPDEVAKSIAFVLHQEPPTNVSSIDLYRRDKLSGF